jgi:NADH:ubiquinone oxidoreductase subunit 6 (subunit J)/NADH:ubiquinone oxidoreductase subunit K
MIIQVIAFYAFAAIAIASGVMVVSSRNPVHSVLFLILAFFSAAGLFVLMGAEFLAMILVVVYVGAVAVLFLFVVMMLDIDFAELRQGFLTYLPIGLVIGIILLVELALVFGAWIVSPLAEVRPARPRPRRAASPTPMPWPRSLHELHLSLRARGLRPAGGNGGGDRADAPPSRGGAPPVDRPADGAPGRRIPRDQERAERQRGILMTIGLAHYLTVAAILFTLGIFGIFLNRKNVIIILMSIELMLLAVNINLVAFSTNLGDLVGQVFAMFVLTVAAAEAAIGLAILVVYFRNRGSIAVEDINMMKG